MTALIVLLLIGLLFGVGALFTAAKWLLIFMLVFWLVGALTYRSGRARV